MPDLRRNALNAALPFVAFAQNDRAELIACLKTVKHRVCGYGQPYGERCDCKYGPEPGKGEVTGCAELTLVIAGVEKMTDLQYHRFIKAWGRVF